MFAFVFMYGSVTDDPHLMEEINDFSRKVALHSKFSQEISLAVFGTGKKARSSGYIPSEQFAELPKLKQSDARIIDKVKLRLRGDPCELRIVLSQKSKVG